MKNEHTFYLFAHLNAKIVSMLYRVLEIQMFYFSHTIRRGEREATETF